MKPQKILFSLLTCLAVMLISCKPQPQILRAKSELKVTERLVKVEVPADSATVVALFRCDSLNNVLLQQISESGSTELKTVASFKKGKLEYKIKIPPKTVQVPVKDSSYYIEKPIPIEVPKIVETNKLTWWQTLFYYSGIAAWSISITLIIVLFLRRVFKIPKPA